MDNTLKLGTFAALKKTRKKKKLRNKKCVNKRNEKIIEVKFKKPLNLNKDLYEN